MPPNRRSRNRRHDTRVREPLQRSKADRRDEERRDSPRPLRSVFIQSSLAPLPIQHRASLSLQGATWLTESPPPEFDVELHLQLPDLPTESIITARIERRTPQADGKTELYAAFLGMDVKSELALARFIDARANLSQALAEEINAATIVGI